MSDNPAYDNGRIAALNGLSTNDSIYTTGTPENVYWLNGFTSVIFPGNSTDTPNAAMLANAVYQAGVTAAIAVQARSTNPYPQDSQQSNDWNGGWDSVQGVG